ncbi:flagellar biosynthesis protein FliQ [Peribacillus asahii]|uniref:Flagellar biosynthetic protein FliQ n=1 Tax=Peribacillus asahii TaxID=228899 RepID=A0A398BI83_9BACI|nr:flagellar biosynthesis protein FliQ [Peribacillus asahii]RID87156.1 flagellar biosynthetic protein FliQ [Peribacillus asahii]USK61222.1 flagellar biosynthesis protein FliQ [Peribacillus asahii]
MSADFVIDVAERGIYTILIVSGPLLLIALGVGLAISIFQATTQIQEQTLAFVPKIVAVLIGIVFLAPWMISHLISYTAEILGNLNRFVG